MKTYLSLSCFLLGLAMCLGAFGSHYLKEHLDAYAIGIWDKATFYHVWNSLGLLFISSADSLRVCPERTKPKFECLMLVVGIVIFSGSLYLLAITGWRWLGAITPLGGVTLIFTWLRLSFFLAKSTT